MIGVVIPTISGRELLLESTVEGYNNQDAETRVYVVSGAKTIGAGWQMGAEAAIRDGVEFVHMSADDVIPSPGCMAAAVDCVTNAGVLPSPRLLNRDGSVLACGTLGAGQLLQDVPLGTPVASSGFPFLPAELATAIMPLPAIHYYCDDFIGWMGRQYDWPTVAVPDYEFRHMEGSVGRARVITRSSADQAEFLRVYVERCGGK